MKRKHIPFQKYEDTYHFTWEKHDSERKEVGFGIKLELKQQFVISDHEILYEN